MANLCVKEFESDWIDMEIYIDMIEEMECCQSAILNGLSNRGYGYPRNHFQEYTCGMIADVIDNLENCLTKVADFLKKADNELQLSNARDSKQAILQLAYNNFVHGWNGTIQSNTIKSSYKTLEDIKRERLESANDGQ